MGRNSLRGEWRIPGERMKMREQHIVPLSRQAIEILCELEPLTNRSIRQSRTRRLEPLTNRSIPAKPDAPRYVFPSARTHERSMSKNAILAALRRTVLEQRDDRPRLPQHGVHTAA